MKVITVESGESGWDSYVDSAKDATAYHQFSWKGIITKSFGHKCYYLAADENGTCHGILPLVHMRSSIFGNFLISVPFVNYGGLVCSNDAAARLLLGEAEQLRRS